MTIRTHRENRQKLRWAAAFSLLGLLLVLLFAAAVCIGSVRIPVSDALTILAGGNGPEMTRSILFDLRLPRALAALILGGALSLSGYLLQTFFHNPLAGPFVLGISSGAKLSVAVCMVLLMTRSIVMNSWHMIGAAFIGSLLCTGFVMLASRRVRSMSILIICGIMIGYICGAATEFIVTFADDSDIVNLHNWSQGSFSGTSMKNVTVMAVVTALSALCAFLLSKPISAYLLGEHYAESVGVNIRLFRLLLVLISSMLSACVTAFAGPVSFVGIAVPQMIRFLFRSSRPLIMIPACFLGGSIFCLFCDLLARTLFAPSELSISTVTAFFGAPVVIAVMMKRSG
ncbi:MAG: iron ABC transporter permease [Firmicutes bacterium]|nr:iron ABC transporter permease [Bacillota bacterium]